MQHITVENLINYIDGQVSGVEKSTLESHVAACRDCAELKQEFQALVNRLKNDSCFEPPADLVQWSINLFQPLAQPQGAISNLRKYIASLVFDTYDQPLLAGVRRVGAPPRQLLFRAGDVDVDVKIESMEANDRITLVGQVLSTNDKFFDNTPVKLESHGIVRYRTRTNVVGEFSFDEVPKDTYHLSVDLPEGQITLFCVHRGNS
jgi:anti-sigma factor ChrR (cupin superfamily)